MILANYWWIIIPGILLGVYAQIRLSSTYNKYKDIPVSGGFTGAQAAREILDAAGLGNLPVRETPGHLTDHYDPVKKALYLSSDNYHGRSMAAVGVAAHEAGHALQHKAAYAPLNWRMMMVPVTNFATAAYLPIFFLGLLFNLLPVFLPLIIGIFAVISLFQAITLPVEFDASRRAKQQLMRLGLVRANESQGVARVLNAAALTYVAAMVTAVLQLLQFILLARSGE